MTPSARIHSVFIAKRKTWWWTEGWLLCCNLLLYCCLTSCPQRELTSPGPVTSSWPVVTLTRRRRRRTATRTTSITAVRKDCKKTKQYKNTKQNHVNNKTEIFGSLFVFSYGGEQRGRRLWKLSDWEEGGGSGPKQKVCRAWRTLTSDLCWWPLTSDSVKKKRNDRDWMKVRELRNLLVVSPCDTDSHLEQRRVKIPPSVTFRREIWTSCVIRWPLTCDLVLQ